MTKVNGYSGVYPSGVVAKATSCEESNIEKKSENKLWFKLAYALPFIWRLLSITVWVLPFVTTFECEHNLNATKDG